MMAATAHEVSKEAAAHDRAHGLDVCRTLAIIAVVYGHMLQHSSPHPWLAYTGFIAVFGVDLFFCLSGFLIGRILMQESQHWPVTKEAGVMRFWYRRWMRTLPLYFFFFFVELYVYWGGASNLAAQKAYLVFAQNFAWHMPSFYGLTWSLTIEEWFYFLFPLLMLAAIAFGKTPRFAVLFTIAVFLLVPPALRFFLFDPQGTFFKLDPDIRHIVIFRLDSLGFGVLAAYLYHWHRSVFQSLVKLRWLFLALALLCMGYIKVWEYYGLPETATQVTIYFTVSALGFAGLLPFFTNLRRSRFAWLNWLVKNISKISYSLYLGHIVAFVASIVVLRKLGWYDTVYPNPWLTYPIFLTAVVSLATITYFLIEKPFLVWRDRKSTPHAPALPQASVGL